MKTTEYILGYVAFLPKFEFELSSLFNNVTEFFTDADKLIEHGEKYLENFLKQNPKAKALTITNPEDVRAIFGVKPAAWLKFLEIHTLQGHNIPKRGKNEDDEAFSAEEVSEGTLKETGSKHHIQYNDLLLRLKARLNVYLVGPAGSGKTKAAEQAAESLSLPFGMMSVGPQTTKSDVFGFIAANGNYIQTEFRKCFEGGGVFLFDEIDAGHAGVITQINAALSGTVCAFPDGMVKKHDDFCVVAAGNTYGTGSNMQYVGRNQLDAASIDRFNFIVWEYDEGLELEIALTLWPENIEFVKSWVWFVQKYRKAVKDLSLRHIVSPRATFDGLKLLKFGAHKDSVILTTLAKGMSQPEKDRVKKALEAEVERIKRESDAKKADPFGDNPIPPIKGRWSSRNIR